MTSSSTAESATQTFLNELSRELFQTEESASRHCRREAERLGDTPPARALLAVSEHADAVLRQLPALADRNGMPVSPGGKLVGDLFSELRDKLADALISSERSYRGTLLGCRHGQDVVRTLSQIATRVGNLELDAFCAAWLNTRGVLVEQLEAELQWFAEHPEQAVKMARPLLPKLQLEADR